MKEFPKIYTQDRELNMIQDAIVNALDPLLVLPLSQSNLLEDIELDTGTNTINHGLGRPLVGWFIVRKNANETVYDDQDNNSMTDRTLLLISSGAVTVSLMVF